MSEPLGELEFYLKRAEATARKSGGRYSLITMMVNNNTDEVKDTIQGDAETLLTMSSYLLSKVILKVWDVLPTDQERIDILATITRMLTDTVTDAWKKAKEEGPSYEGN